MAINKKLIHFKNFTNFNSKKLSANENNTSYTLGVYGSVTSGTPEILYQSICWIKDSKMMWTHGTLYDCSTVNLSNYATIEEVELRNVAIVSTSDSVDEPEIGDYVTTEQLNDYATLEYVDTQLGDINSVLESIIGDALTFPITLIIGDNGDVGINLFNYLYDKYSTLDIINEDIYVNETRITTIAGKTEDYIGLMYDAQSSYILSSAGVITLGGSDAN